MSKTDASKALQRRGSMGASVKPLPAQHSNFNNSNDRRKLRLERQLLNLQNELIQDVTTLCLQDAGVYHSRKSNQTRETKSEQGGKESIFCDHKCFQQEACEDYTNIYTTVHHFVKSLPPRYVFSIESVGEALIHMRHLDSVRHNPLNCFIHITRFEKHETLSICTDGSTNLKTVLVCCVHTIGLMEFLMGTLVSGGNELFDTNFLLSSDKIMLIRCVINLKGVTRFERLQQQLNIFIRAARGIPCDPTMVEELPVPTKIGPFDPTKVHHQSHPHTIMGMEEDLSFVDVMNPPVPLSNVIGTEEQDDQSDDESSQTRLKSGSNHSVKGLIRQESNVASVTDELQSTAFFGNMILNGSIMYGTDVVVYRGQEIDKDKKTYALKVFAQNKIDNTKIFQDVVRETKVAMNLSHPNICQFIDVIQTPSHICIAFEFCSKGPLSRIVQNQNVTYDYLPIAQDISNGMAYLHSKNVIHRDLKPDNILIDAQNRAKVTDFGLSVTHTGIEELTGETGTYRWMAPEVIRHEPYSINSDIYSFALVLWNLVTREIPFDIYTPVQAAFAVARDAERPPIPDHIPEYIARIICSSWEQDQLKRPSFANVSMGLSKYSSTALAIYN